MEQSHSVASAVR